MGDLYSFKGPRFEVPEGIAKWGPGLTAHTRELWAGRTWRGVRVEGVAWITNGHVMLRATKVGDDVGFIDAATMRGALADRLRRRRVEVGPATHISAAGVAERHAGALTLDARIVAMVEATLRRCSWWAPRRHDRPAHVLSVRGRLEALVMGRGPFA